MAVLQTGLAKSLAEDYTIDQSLRFEDADDPALTRTFSAGNQQIWTFSCWLKRGNLSTIPCIFGYDHGTADSNWMEIGFLNDAIVVQGYVTRYRLTDALYRDPSAWYHIVVTVDTPQDAGADRIKVYVNGDQVTSFATNNDPSEDANLAINQANSHVIGDNMSGGVADFDGYFAEVYFTDGTAYAASDFGETDSATNQWKPIDASDLTFGTNGFYQKYAATELANSFIDSSESGKWTVTVTGNVHTDTAVKKFGTASAQFDGTDDRLGVSSTSLLNVSSAGTIEAWVYFNSFESGTYVWYAPTIFAKGDTYAHLGVNSSGTVDFYIYTGSGNDLNSSTNLSLSTWHHVAGTWNASGRKIYIDGVEVASSATSLSSMHTDANNLELVMGEGLNAGAKTIDGYVDEIRISDIDRYPNNFPVATEAFTSDNNTMLLLHMDGANDGTTFTDSSGHIITANGDVANTRAVRKIGDSSIKFDGSGDYLQDGQDQSDFEFGGTGDFTVECWINKDSGGGGQWANNIITYGTSSAGTSSWKIYGGQYIWGYIWEGGGNYNVTATTDTDDDAWHHVAMTRDGNTLRLYIDGVQEDTSDVTGVTMNTSSSAILYVGEDGAGVNYTGYQDEIRVSDSCRYPDGTTFTPSTTEFTADSNTMLLIHSNWDGGLGADSSGNYNTFTPTNLLATDKMLDSPTNNFATLNPLIKVYGTTTLSEGNLKTVDPAGNWNSSVSGISVSSGKWYWEMYDVTGTNIHTGIWAGDNTLAFNGGLNPQTASSILYYGADGQKRIDGTFTSYGASFTAGDIIGVALDLDSGTQTITFYKNDSSQGVINLSGDCSTSSFVVPGNANLSSTIVMNFGSDSSFAGNETAQGNQDGNSVGDFYYEPPTDFLALCTSNLPDPEIKLPGDNFNTIIYSGDDANPRTLTGVGFQSDLTWIKSRTGAYSNQLFDAVRGVGEVLYSNNTSEEYSDSATGHLSAWTSDGYTVSGSSNTEELNDTGQNYVAWNWLGANGTATNEDGDITSTVSANTTAGFSIVGYTGDDSSSATVGHGLSQAPEMIILKKRSGAAQWPVGSAVANSGIDWNDYIALDKSNNSGNYPYWNDTAPTSSVFSIGTDNDVNELDGTYIAYCFHSVEGYSKVGAYEGNASTDGTFVYCSFRPAFLLLKSIDGSAHWEMEDDKRDPYNLSHKSLQANLAYAEDTSTSRNGLDFVSNGFKFRSNSSNVMNGSETYLYIAFADSPFKYANAR